MKKHPDEFQIPPAEFPDGRELTEAFAQIFEGVASATGRPAEPRALSLPSEFVKALADLATNAWKARLKMIDPASGEPREEMRRVYPHVNRMLDTLGELGLEVKDHTGDTFDYGLPLKVITTQPTPGLDREKVVETIKPTIYWQRKIIQAGEVVIAIPAAPETKA